MVLWWHIQRNQQTMHGGMLLTNNSDRGIAMMNMVQGDLYNTWCHRLSRSNLSCVCGNKCPHWVRPLEGWQYFAAFITAGYKIYMDFVGIVCGNVIGFQCIHMVYYLCLPPWHSANHMDRIYRHLTKKNCNKTRIAFLTHRPWTKWPPFHRRQF